MKKASLCLLALAALASLGFARDLKPRIVFEKYLFAEGVDPKARHLDQLMVKFFDEDMVRVRDGMLTSVNGRNSLGYVQDFLARHPEIRVEKIISEPEASYAERMQITEERSGIDLVDLFSFYNFRLPAPAADPRALLADILKAPEVEIAYYESIPVQTTCQDLGTPTPNYIGNQGYHDPAPGGVDLDFAVAAYGADVVDGAGTGTWTAVIEYSPGFQFGHEDFTLAENATPEVTPNNSFHGTAVMGVMGACDDNGVGVLGFLADQRMRGYDIGALASVADVYNRVNTNLVAGEVTNSSWGYFSSPMPPGQSCPCNPGQNGMVGPEYVPSVKAAIQAGVAEGIHYFLSAGNGCTNMDHAVYGNTFRWSTETGSCYVGGLESNATHNAICYTNWGERVTLCGWSENVVTTGYGTLFSGTGINEYYTAGFNGTSSASPIVAGTAGVVNNIYRELNGGANISPANMRAWLDDWGTSPGTTPGNIGLFPNLRGITAPELNPDLRAGWTNYLVPRNANDATGDAAALPANLNSVPSPTYWNSALENTSNIGTATPGYWRLYRDDTYIVWSNYGSMGPQFRGYSANIQGGAADVRGGRHTIRMTCDPLNDVAEASETNNSYTTQYVWDPRPLAGNAPLELSRPPTRYVTDQPGSYPNCDGYSGTGLSGWWDILAVLSQSADDDYDIRIHSEAVSSTNGFDDTEASSAYVGWVDLVGINNNMQAGTLLGSIINWDDANSNYIVEAGTSTILTTPTFARTLVVDNGGIDTDEIFDNWEFYADQANIPYSVELDVLSGDANLVISVFGPDDLYFGLPARNFQANAGGDGADEFLTFTPTVTGWFGIVVHKLDGNSWGDAATFDLYLGKSLSDLTHTSLGGWSHQLVIRQSSSPVPAVLPATLTGWVAAVNYFNASYINQGAVNSPAGINNQMYVDGQTAWTTGDWASWAPGATTFWSNQGPVFVSGGRHTVSDVIDYLNEGAEWIESNNRRDEQFVWTPYVLTNNAVVTVTHLAPNFRDSGSNIPFGSQNHDGFRATMAPYWSGVGGTPWDPDDDYNVRLFAPSTGSQDGFVSHLVPSWITADGITEFVVANGNLLGAQTYDVGVQNNFAWPATPSEGGYYVHQSNRIEDLAVNALNGPYTLGVNQLINVFDVNLTSGTPTRFILDNLGGVDLGLAIFDANDSYGSRGENGTVINLAGDGADETTVFTPTSTGWHGVVVFKHDYSDLASTQYSLIVGERVPRVPAGLVVEVLNSQVNPIQIRLAWAPVTLDNNGDPVAVDHYNVYFTSDDTNVFPTGWLLAGTTPATEVGVTVPNTLLYLRFLVTAVDENGYILGGSGPDAERAAGMREADAGIQATGGAVSLVPLTGDSADK